MKKGMVLVVVQALMGVGAAQASEQVFQASGHARNVTFVVEEDCRVPSKMSVQQTEFAAKANADEEAQKLCGESLKAKRVSEFQISTQCRYSGPWYSYSTLYKDVVADYVCE